MVTTWSEERQYQLRHTLWDLGLCHCGSGTTWQVLKELLQRAKDNDEGGPRLGFYKPFDDASGRWSEFGAHVLDSMDLVEHGTGIGWPWLTDKGRMVLEFLNEFGVADDDWPEWAVSEAV